MHAPSLIPNNITYTTVGVDDGHEAVAGPRVAQSIQLGLEYDPAPPFASGHPDVADPELVAEQLDEVAQVTRGAQDGQARHRHSEYAEERSISPGMHSWPSSGHRPEGDDSTDYPRPIPLRKPSHRRLLRR